MLVSPSALKLLMPLATIVVTCRSSESFVISLYYKVMSMLSIIDLAIGTLASFIIFSFEVVRGELNYRDVSVIGTLSVLSVLVPPEPLQLS